MGDPNFPATDPSAGTCGAGTCGAGTCGAGTCGTGTCGTGTCGAGTCCTEFCGVMVLQRASARCCTVTPKSHMMGDSRQGSPVHRH